MTRQRDPARTPNASLDSAVGVRRARAVPFVAVAALAAAIASTPAPAQELEGRVVDEGAGTPVQGAMTALVDSAGAQVASTLTGPEGAYSLEAPAPGRYRLRVERIGYRTWTSDAIELRTGRSRSFRAAVPPEAVELEGLEVAAERRCRVDPARGSRAAVLWEEARKALTAAETARDEARVRFELRRWHRIVGPDGRVREETSEEGAGLSLRPFRSPPADELAREGYVREAGEGRVWFAPDARALLSEEFRRDHCLSVREAGGRDGWIGLSFRPVEGREAPDVSGVLWLDRTTFELRRMDFGYANVDLPPDVRDVGGRIEFQRLPSGLWIVREWRIRMPRIGRDQYHDRVAAGHEIEGGEVVAATTDGGRHVDLARRATLLGRVRYGGSGGPAAGAAVGPSGTGLTARTDSSGRFRLEGIPPGRYVVEVEPPLLGDLGVRLELDAVELEGRESREVTLSLPSRRALVGRICRPDGNRPDDRPVALVGRVRGPAGGASTGADVRARTSAGGAGRETGPIADAAMTVTAETDSAGIYVLCGAPPGGRVTVRASGPAGRSPEAEVELPEEGLARRDLRLERPRRAAGEGAGAGEGDGRAGGTGAVAGRVVAADTGEPLASAKVVLGDGPVRTVTDSAGRFRVTGVAAGDAALRVRFLGHDSRARTLHVPAGDTLRPTVALETRPVEVADLRVEVEGTEVAGRMSGFWERRDRGLGAFLTREEIEETPGDQLHRVLRDVPQMRVRRCPPPQNPPPGCYRVETGRGAGALSDAGCEPALFVDGARTSSVPGEGVNIVPTQDIEAIEVYMGAAQTPARFGGVETGRCGAVVIWTRSPGGSGDEG